MFLRCYTITPRRDFTERRVSTKGDSGLENKQNKQNTQTSATEMGGNGKGGHPVSPQELGLLPSCFLGGYALSGAAPDPFIPSPAPYGIPHRLLLPHHYGATLVTWS